MNKMSHGGPVDNNNLILQSMEGGDLRQDARGEQTTEMPDFNPVLDAQFYYDKLLGLSNGGGELVQDQNLGVVDSSSLLDSMGIMDGVDNGLPQQQQQSLAELTQAQLQQPPQVTPYSTAAQDQQQQQLGSIPTFQYTSEQPDSGAAVYRDSAADAVGPHDSPSQSALHDFYNDKFLDELNWNFTTDSMSAIFNDSTTLPSARTSYEYRSSTEVFDSMSQFEDENSSPLNSTPSRFRTSISNSLSSIFKSNNPNRFNLRGINPLSTHKDAELMVSTLPTLENSEEDLTRVKDEEQQQQPKKQKNRAFCDQENNLHAKGCTCNGKKSRTQSLVNAIASARLTFNSKSSTQPIPETTEEEKISFEFDEELSRVISLASMNSSTYNFNNNKTNTVSQSETSPVVGRISSDSSLPMEVDDVDMDEDSNRELKQDTNEEGDQKKHSPDYAALFSDVKTSKKRSHIFRGPFSKGQGPQDTKGVGQLPTLPEDTATDAKSFRESETNLSIPIQLQNEPPRRGRKPTLEYDPAKQFVCSYCMRRFKRQEHLKRHVRSLHTNEKPFDCTLCGKQFSRSDNLAQHIKTHNQMNADGQSADEQNDESP